MFQGILILWMCRPYTNLSTKFLKYFVTGQTTKTSVAVAVLGEFGEYPVCEDDDLRQLNVGSDYKNLPDSSIVQQMFLLQMRLHNLGHRTRVTDVKRK